VEIEPVSGRRLPKTEIFQMPAGDYRLFWSENAADRSLAPKSQKPAIGGAFLRVIGTFSLSSDLAGWRRSADRTVSTQNPWYQGILRFWALETRFGTKKPLRCSTSRAIPYGN
jgi:hypothetical protein